MGVKRILSVILAVLLMAALALPAAADNGLIEAGRISVLMPQITVELKGSGYDRQNISASLDGENIEVRNAEAYDPAKHSSRVYVLVDLSTSMWSCFDLIKANITTYIQAMGEKDQLVLLTFGENTVETVLNGSEDRQTAIDAVQALRCDEEGTLFYEALSRAYQMSSASTEQFHREYVLAFSDGVDYQRGNTTFNEVLNQYDSRALPLYAACTSNTSQAGADQFGQIARTSGGSLSIIKNEEMFAQFLAQINDVTLLQLWANTNRADGKEKQLTLKIDSLQAEFNVPIQRSQEDNEAPSVESVVYDAEKSALVVTYSEKVLGAAEAKAYKLTGPDGAAVTISGVYYSEKDDAYELQLTEPAYNGTYTLFFTGITDAAQEENPLDAEQTLHITNGAVPETTPTTEPDDSQGSPSDDGNGNTLVLVAAAGGGLLLVIIVVVVIVIVTAGKKKEEDVQPAVQSAPTPAQLHEYDAGGVNVVKHHIKATNSIRLRLRIVTGKTSEQNIETDLVSSLIIGRSEACDIYIDDTKMSRQHFVLENDNGTLYVTDLQSRNGTMLNGTRISSRHILHSGDRILAGLSDIYITVTGR